MWCLFRALYDHAGNSAGDFYWWISHLLTESKTWSGIKGGLRYFGDDAMLRLLEETERFLTARKQQEDAVQHATPSWDIGNDLEFAASVDQLNATFHQTATETLKLIGEYIRTYPSEFVHIED